MQLCNVVESFFLSSISYFIFLFLFSSCSFYSFLSLLHKISNSVNVSLHKWWLFSNIATCLELVASRIKPADSFFFSSRLSLYSCHSKFHFKNLFSGAQRAIFSWSTPTNCLEVFSLSKQMLIFPLCNKSVILQKPGMHFLTCMQVKRKLCFFFSLHKKHPN